MANQNHGILPYNTDDDSVLLRCTLTSQADLAALGGSIPNAGTCTFDSVKGVSANATNGGVRFTTVPGYASLNYAGQISYEIERRGICVTNRLLPSVGEDQTANAHVLVLRPAAATTNYFRHLIDPNERLFYSFNCNGAVTSTSPSTSSMEVTSAGKDEFVRMTLSWVGDLYEVYIDGTLFFVGSRGGRHTADVGERIEIMSGAGLGNAIIGIYARNLLVSRKPVRFFSHPSYPGKVGFVGHSFGNRAKRTNPTDFYRDVSISDAIQKSFGKRGFNINIPRDNSTIFASSGATILRSGGNPLKTQVDLCVAAKCCAVIYLGGTNDAINASYSSVNRAQVLADLKLDIIDLMAVPGCNRLFLPNVTSVWANSPNFATSRKDETVKQINDDFLTIEPWWNALNPTRAGQVVHIDMYTKFGKAFDSYSLFQGGLLGEPNDLHPSAPGNVLYGDILAGAMLDAA